jgi:DNA-binding IclR family transcriptional regulator
MPTSTEIERVQVIDRVADLLEALQDGPHSLKEICEITELSKATAFRLLGGLALRGVVMKSPNGGVYMLGPGLLRLARAALGSITALTGLGRDGLEDLAAETGETVALHIANGLERIYVDEVPSAHAIRYTSLVGSTAPLHFGASGIVLLAFIDDDQRERALSLLEASGVELDRRAVERKIKAAQRDGFSIDLGGRLAAASAVAVPVISDRILLALGVIGSSSRLTAARLEGFVPLMTPVAADLARLLDGPAGQRAIASASGNTSI